MKSCTPTLRFTASARVLLLLVFSVWFLAPIASAQKLDLDAKPTPKLHDGGVIPSVLSRLNTQAEAFEAELRALPESASLIEREVLQARAKMPGQLARWLVDADAIEKSDPARAAVLRADALALAALIGPLDAAFRAINPQSRDTIPDDILFLAMELRIACDPMSFGMASLFPADQPHDPQLRSIAGCAGAFIRDEVHSEPVVLVNPIAEIASKQQWPADTAASMDEDIEAWAKLAVTDRLFRQWIASRLRAVENMLALIEQFRTPQQAAALEAARDCFVSAYGPNKETADRGIYGVLQDAALADAMLSASQTLSVSSAAAGAQQHKAAFDALRETLFQRWVSGSGAASDQQVAAMLHRLALASEHAQRARPRSTEQPGPLATERSLRATLENTNAEILQAIPTILDQPSQLSSPQFITLLAKHRSTTQRLSNYLDLPAKRAELAIEQGLGVESLLIGRVSNRLARWQRETVANDASVVESAHQGIAAYSHLHDAYRAFDARSVAQLARAIDRPGLARHDWAQAAFNLRRLGLVRIGEAAPSEAALEEVHLVADRLEAISSLARHANAAQSDFAWPFLRCHVLDIETALNGLRDTNPDVASALTLKLQSLALALASLDDFISSDAAAAAALAAGFDRGAAAGSAEVIAESGRPWANVGPARVAAAHAVRWACELRHAVEHNAPADQQSLIAAYAMEMLQDWRDASTPSQ